MLFVKYALFLFALLSISTAIPVGQNNPDSKKPKTNLATSKYQRQGAQPDPQPGFLYLTKGYSQEVAAFICLGPADRSGRFSVVNVVEQGQATSGSESYKGARAYFDNSFIVLDGKRIDQFVVHIARVYDVNKAGFGSKLEKTSTKGFDLLQKDIENFKKAN